MFVFFFVKQKTAYEMRISDWSSDVCSSDLLTGAAVPAATLAVLLLAMAVDLVAGDPAWLYRVVLHPVVLLGRAVGSLERLLNRQHQIGRASCRERVCQYV